MARFLSYEELKAESILTKEEITEISRQIMALPEFELGIAVVFGSAAWESHTWRSDIDVADNSPLQESEAQYKIFKLLQRWADNKNIDPVLLQNTLIEVLSSEGKNENYAIPELSSSTRDYFRLLAQNKGG